MDGEDGNREDRKFLRDMVKEKGHHLQGQWDLQVGSGQCGVVQNSLGCPTCLNEGGKCPEGKRPEQKDSLPTCHYNS